MVYLPCSRCDTTFMRAQKCVCCYRINNLLTYHVYENTDHLLMTQKYDGSRNIEDLWVKHWSFYPGIAVLENMANSDFTVISCSGLDHQLRQFASSHMPHGTVLCFPFHFHWTVTFNKCRPGRTVLQNSLGRVSSVHPRSQVVSSKQPKLGLTNAGVILIQNLWVHNRLHIYPLCGIFYFPWHRHQIEGTTGF